MTPDLPNIEVLTITAVCSNRPRPSVQKGAKGSQYWTRDVYHAKGNDGKTLCGLKTDEFLIIGETMPDHNLCERCKKKFSATKDNQP